MTKVMAVELFPRIELRETFPRTRLSGATRIVASTDSAFLNGPRERLGGLWDRIAAMGFVFTEYSIASKSNKSIGKIDENSTATISAKQVETPDRASPARDSSVRDEPSF